MNEPTLIAAAQDHYWVQFDAGGGMTDADPLIPTAAVGTSFASVSQTFAEVPDGLRAKTEVTLSAETYSSARAAFGLGGFGTDVVLNQVFNDVDLVGRPLTVDNFVNTDREGGLGFFSVVNTYSPYIQQSDEAFPDPDQDLLLRGPNELIRGQDYQEYVSNFPFGNQFLTGVFLHFTLTGPGGVPQGYDRTLIDRIGFAGRHTAESTPLQIDPTGPPIISALDLWTVNALPGLQSPAVVAGQRDALAAVTDRVAALPAGAPLDQVNLYEREIASLGNENVGILFAAACDNVQAQMAPGYQVKSYYTSPRLLISTTRQVGDHVEVSLDLLRNDTFDTPYPGQAVSTTLFYEVLRGEFESNLEAWCCPAPPAGRGDRTHPRRPPRRRQGRPDRA